jgi:hypothetical protein
MQYCYDLSNHRTVFCESLQALRQAWDAGLPRDALILFRSPALVASPDIINGFNLDLRARGKSQTYRDIYLEIEQTTYSLYCESLKYFNKSQSLIIGRTYPEWLSLCYSASLLSQEDLSEKRLIIDPAIDTKLQPTYRRAHWNALLQRNAKAEIWCPNVDVVPFNFVAPLSLRLGVMGTRHYLWRLLQTLQRKKLFRDNDKTIYYCSDSELVREVGLEFAFHGYRIEHLDLKKLGQNEDGGNQSHFLTEEFDLPDSICELLRTAVCGLVEPDFYDTIVNQYAVRVHKEFDVYSSTLNNLEKSDGRYEKSIILSNYPSGAEAVALGEYCRNNQSVFAATQHGITREFLHNPQNLINYEHTVATHFISFTERAQTLSSKVTKYSGTDYRGISCGLPRCFWSIHSKQQFWSNKKLKKLPLLMVGSLNARGYIQNGGVFISDQKNIETEKSVFRAVSRAVPSVEYKPYPTKRYIDFDPFVEQILKKITAKEAVRKFWDFRYVEKQYRGFIMSGATSTLSWVLMTGKPVIFLDQDVEAYRLSSEAKEALKATVFYFDMRDSKFLEDLTSFLVEYEQSLEEEWFKMLPARSIFIENLMRPSQPDKVYEFLKNELSRLSATKVSENTHERIR